VSDVDWSEFGQVIPMQDEDVIVLSKQVLAGKRTSADDTFWLPRLIGTVIDAKQQLVSIRAERNRLTEVVAEQKRKIIRQDQKISAAEESLRKEERRSGHLAGALRDVTLNPKSDDTRASGRTTRLILRGLIALSEGQDVFVIAATTVHAQTLASQIKRMATQHGIPILDRRILSGVADSERTGFRCVTLVDHHAIERIEEAK
jgi:hypothetical protein